MVKKLIYFFCSLVLIFILAFPYSVLADPVPQLSQTISLVEVLPSDVSLKGRYTSNPQDPWFNYTRYTGPTLSSPLNYSRSYFPADSNGNYKAKYSGFRGQNFIYGETLYSETYTLPSFDFSFDFCYVSIIYVFEVSNIENPQPSWDIDTCNVDITKSNGNSQNYAGYVKTYETVNNRTSYLMQFDISLLEFSDSITSITFNVGFEIPQMVASSTVTVMSNVFPFVVTSDYEGTELFTAATYTLIQNNILPTIDNISQTMNNMSSAISAQAAQQSQVAAAQMSQSAQQHSEEMAALSSLPQAQADAQIDAAESNAAAHVEAEMASEAAARESVAAQIPQYNSSVGGIEEFLNSINTHLRSASFDFPALILPGMSGVYSGGTLSSSHHFSFDDLFSGDNPVIPPIILTLVQAICTIGLSCFLIRYIQKFITQILGGTGNEGTV